MSDHVTLKWTYGPDKLDHVFVGGFIAFVLTAFCGPLIAIAAALAAGIGKEVYDYFHPNHDCDVWDAICTFGGAVFGLGCVELVKTAIAIF